MRQILRALLTSAFVASLALAGTATVALAAPDNDSRNGRSYEMYEDWCFDDIKVIFCWEVHGRFNVVDQNDGDQIATGAVRTRSFVVEGGIVVAAAQEHTVFQSAIVDGVFAKEVIISHARSLTLDGQCVTQLQVRFEDGVLVVDRGATSCH